jgi:hypothetical protein
LSLAGIRAVLLVSNGTHLGEELKEKYPSKVLAGPQMVPV